METTKPIHIRPGSAALWTGILAGPIAWLVDLQVNYALLQWICLNRADWVLWAITLLMLAATAFGAFEARRGMAADDSRRARFMGLAGLFISASFFLGILSTSAVLVALKACD